MNIYDAISGDPLTPQKLLQIKKEEAQKQYQDALTPNDKVKLETKITNTVNNIKNDQFEYQKSLLNSPVTSNKLAKEYEDKTSDMIIKVDEESNPLFDMSTDQYKVYSNMIANSSDIDKTKNDLDSALLFSNILGISLEEAYQNKDQLAAQYGKGRWGNNPNMFEDLKTSFSIGAKSSKASKLGNNLVKLEAKAEGLEGEELTKQEGLIQETLDQIDELNSYIDTHSSYLDDGIGRKLLRGFGTNAPQMGEVLAYSAAIGATIATAGVALPIIAGTTAALGTSALVGAGSLSVFGAALTTMLKSKELTKGSMYVDLRKKGISAKTARDTADIVGSFTGFTEVAFDAIPMGFVKTIFGKSVGNKVLSSFVQKLAINPALSKILLTSGEAIKSGAGEGVQEFVQSLAETIGTYMAESIEENGASTLYEGFSKLDKDDLNKAYADAAMGFGLGLMMGSPSYIYNAHFDIKQYNELKGIASNTDSKADFVKKGAKITPKTEHNTLGDLFDKFKKKEEKTKVSDIISPDLENIKNTSKVGEEEILTPKKKKQETSTKVELSPRSRNVKLKGNNITETAVFDSNKKKAGNITFLNKNDSIEVVGIDINNTNLIKSTMQEIIAKYPNKEVIWDTNNDVDLDLIKDELIDENPRGEEFGLSYYNFSTEDSEIASKIKKPFNLNNEQAVVATSLVKLHAKKEGLSVSQWMDKNIESIKSVGLDSNKRGGIKINQSKKGINAVIYTARNSDFSTFTHEVFHLSISQMDNKGDLAGYIKNWAKNEEFITFYNENKNIFDADFETTLKAAQEFDPNNDNWTTRQEELAASIYETWLKQGTTNVPELDSLMSKISEWFKEIYKSVKSTVKVNDDISSFFDSMYSQEEGKTPTTTDEIESSTKKEVKDIVNEIVPAKEETVKSPEVETNQQNIDKHNAEVISKQTDEDVIKEMIEAGKKFNPNVDTSKVLYQTTFQGTVYEFEKHSMDYVGKGEGTQFFGWGMYVSQSDTVARGYAIRAYDEKHKEFYKTNDEKVEDIIKKSKTYSTTRDMFQDLINYKFFDKKTKEESIQEEKELIDDNENNIKYLEGFLLDNNDKEDVNSLLEEIEDFKKTISFLNKKIDFINKYYDSLVKSSNGIDHRVLYNIEIPDEGYINWTEKLPDDFADRFHDIMVNHGFDGDDASVIIENAINRKRTKYITSNNNTTEVSGTLETFHRNITIDDYFNEDYSQESINTSVLTPKQTSMFLSEMGYKGIKYPIGSVHGNGHNKKSNFVIFNADDMKITNKTLFQSENSDLKKLNKDNSISVDENNEIISVNLVDSRGDRWLFQQKTKYKERKDAVIIASKMNSVVEFKDLYSENSKKHTDKWYENVFKDGLELAASEAVETLYYGEDTKTKNNIFSNSLKSDSLIDGFIRQLKVLKRDVEDISQKDKLMLDDKMKIDFYKEITDVIPEEIMNKTRLSKKSREEIRNINTEDSSSLRNIYARLFGIEYMTDDGIFADVDYFEDSSDLVEANKITMAKALTNFSEPETKKRLRENYKKALTDMETHTKKLKEEISALKEKNQKQIDKLKENKEANKKQIAEIKSKQKEDIKKLRADYEAKLKEKDNVAYYKALKKNINRNIPESIRDDYARDIKAIQVLFNGTARNSFKTLNGERWSPKLVKDIIEKNMGEMFSDMFDEDFLQDLADSNATEKEALYSTDELEFFNLLANKLRDKGYELRKQDKLERKERNSDIRDALSEGLDSSYKRVKNTLPNKFYEKLSPVRLVFSATMNIERKAVLLDGFNKKGPYQSLLLDKRRELSSQKAKRIDERMKKVTDVMDKNKVSLIDLSKSVYETKFGGEIQKHSIADLFYYYYSLQNNDNIMAVSCGLLMTKGERRDITNISDKDFFEKAETRYKDVVEKSLEYVNNPKYSEIFDTIWKEFNNDSIDKINSILLKTLNKQVRVVKNYLPLVRRNFANKEVQGQFEQDIEGRQYYDTNTTKYGALTERQKISARNQEPINTNMLSLLQDSVEKQEHLLAFYDYVKDLKYIFLSKDSISLKNNILEKYGDEMFEDIETFIQEVANPYASRSEGRIDQLAEVLTGNLYPSYLGLKTSTIMMQFITSPAAFKGKMNIPEFLGSFLNTLTHKKKVIKKVNELSPFMKNRAWDYSWADIKKVLKQYNGNKNSKILKYEKFLEFSMGGLQIADQMTVYSGWMQLYKTELERLQIENSSASINENTKLAVKYADDYVRKTQPNSDVVEVAQIFKGGAASKIFTRFTASLSPIYQNLTFDSYQLWKNKDYKELFGLISGYAIVGGLLYAIKGGYDKSDDGEEKFKKLLYSFMSQGASSVPIIGNLVDYTFKSIITGEKSGLFFTNLLPPVESILEAQRKFSDSDFMEGVQSMAEGIGIFAGFPISATKEYYSAIKEKSLLPLLGNKK